MKEEIMFYNTPKGYSYLYEYYDKWVYLGKGTLYMGDNVKLKDMYSFDYISFNNCFIKQYSVDRNGIGECSFVFRDYGVEKNCSEYIIKQKNNYHFRGYINLEHLCADCFKDSKNCFIAVSKDVVHIGFVKMIDIEKKQEFMSVFDGYDEIYNGWFPYHVYKIKKQDISLGIKTLKEIDRYIKNKIKKEERKLNKRKLKGEFSNKPETKVMVF